MDGIIYEIDSAVDTDNGTYECHLNFFCMDEEKTSTEIERDLIVTSKTFDSAPLAIVAYNIVILVRHFMVLV